MAHFNELNPAEAERLALLLEELGETQHIIGKILRHGYASYNPRNSSRKTNRELLEKELSHVSLAVAIMVDEGDLDLDNIGKCKKKKRGSVWKYMHHNTKKVQK